MSSTAMTPSSPYATAPNLSEKVLGWLSVVLLATVIVAIARGASHWHEVPWTIWAHLATVLVALAITPAILWYPRGSRRHRILGYIWVGSLTITAVLTFWIRTINPGGFSVIHLISLFTLVMLPRVVLAARSHKIRQHRRAVRGLVIGALLIAGFFTLPFGRMLGSWLFG